MQTSPLFLFLVSCSFLCLLHLTTAGRGDVKPHNWKMLKIAAGTHNVSSARKRYNCSALIRELSDVGINVTDCTVAKGSLWYRIDDIQSWELSWESCRHIPGSDLASIHDVDEFNLLRHLFWMPDQDHTGNWIGLNDILEENRWTWTDSTSAEYTRWLSPMKEPNGGTEENCVMYQAQVAGGGCCWADGLLDVACDSELPAICKLRNPRA